MRTPPTTGHPLLCAVLALLALAAAGRAAAASYPLPPPEFDLVGTTRIVEASREDTLIDIARP